MRIGSPLVLSPTERERLTLIPPDWSLSVNSQVLFLAEVNAWEYIEDKIH
jgi:hypothetical protein